MARLLNFVAAFVLLAGVALAQMERGAWLTVHSNIERGQVYVDSVLVGVAPLTDLRVGVGVHHIRVAPLDEMLWFSVNPDTLVSFSSGDSLLVELKAEYSYRIESIPFGAEIVGSGVSYGTTPGTITSSSRLDSPLTLRLDGFLDEEVRFGPGLSEHRIIRLRSLDAGPAMVSQSVSSKSRRLWIDGVALGVALIAGGISVSYKNRADNIYDRYAQTGDPLLRPDFERYDRIAGWSLGAMQAGVAVFGVRLLLR